MLLENPDYQVYGSFVGFFILRYVVVFFFCCFFFCFFCCFFFVENLDYQFHFYVGFHYEGKLLLKIPYSSQIDILYPRKV